MTCLAAVRDFFQRLASERPRVYGLTMLGVGTMAFSLCMLLHQMGRISYVLVLLTPVPFVFGTQSLVLGTTPEQLRADRVTSSVLFVISLAGTALLFGWMTR